MQITEFEFHARLSQHKRLLREIQGMKAKFLFHKCFSVLGTPAFALKETFKITHHQKQPLTASVVSSYFTRLRH